MNFPATGHMNPTLVLAKELCERHIPVTYFVSESVKPVVEATGATWRPLQALLSDFKRESDVEEDTLQNIYDHMIKDFCKRSKF